MQENTMKTYEAILMSWHKEYSYPNPSRGGFKSYQDAAKYVQGYICDSCLAQVKAGVQADGDFEIFDALGTSCGAQWLIFQEEPQNQNT